MGTYRNVASLHANIGEYYNIILDAIEKSGKDAKIVIWGNTRHMLRFVNYFTEKGIHNIELWDKNEKLVGANMGQYIIQKPFASQREGGGGGRDNTFFIITFSQNQMEARIQIKMKGYKWIVSGSAFMEHILCAKSLADYEHYKKTNTDADFPLNDNDLLFYTGNAYSPGGASFKSVIVCSSIWTGRKVLRHNPKRHHDIGSFVEGFISGLLFTDIEVVLFDYRPVELGGFSNLTFIQEDATHLLGVPDDSIESLSALGSLEHFGLGMYGEPCDPASHLLAYSNMQRVMKPGGHFYFAIPVAKESFLRFHLRRVFSPSYVCEQFQSMELSEFAYISQNGLRENASINVFEEEDLYAADGKLKNDILDGDLYFGLFDFVKK